MCACLCLSFLKNLPPEMREAQEKKLEGLKKQQEIHTRLAVERKIFLRDRKIKFFGMVLFFCAIGSDVVVQFEFHMFWYEYCVNIFLIREKKDRKENKAFGETAARCLWSGPRGRSC